MALDIPNWIISNDTHSTWSYGTQRSSVNGGCALNVMSYMSFAMIGIYTAINLNVNNVSHEINYRKSRE